MRNLLFIRSDSPKATVEIFFVKACAMTTDKKQYLTRILNKLYLRSARSIYANICLLDKTSW